MWDKMTKKKLKSLNNMIEINAGGKLVKTKEERGLLERLIVVSRSRPHSPVATPICSVVNLVAVGSVLFFDMEVIIWVYRCFLAWLPERQLWGTLVICINPRWPLWMPGSLPDGISFN